jgi:hypothetical protein
VGDDVARGDDLRDRRRSAGRGCREPVGADGGGGGRGRRDLPGRLVGLRRRRAGRDSAVAVEAVRVVRTETAPAMAPALTAFLSVLTSRGLSTPSLRRPAARSKSRTLLRVAGPNAPSVAAGNPSFVSAFCSSFTSAPCAPTRRRRMPSQRRSPGPPLCARLSTLRKRFVTRAERSSPASARSVRTMVAVWGPNCPSGFTG